MFVLEGGPKVEACAEFKFGKGRELEWVISAGFPGGRRGGLTSEGHFSLQIQEVLGDW